MESAERVDAVAESADAAPAAEAPEYASDRYHLHETNHPGAGLLDPFRHDRVGAFLPDHRRRRPCQWR